MATNLTVQPGIRNQFIARLLAEGSKTDPVQHWTQGMARALQGAVGGLERGRVEYEDKQNDLAQNAALAAMLSGNPSPQPAQPTAPAPPMAPPVSPRPPASGAPQNVSGPVPANDPTMTVSPRQVAMANAPQGAPAAPSPMPPAAPPTGGAPPTPPGAPPMTSSAAPQDMQASVKAMLQDPNPAIRAMGKQWAQKLLADRMKPPEFGVIDKDEFGNDRRGWINPNTRELTPAGPPSIPNFVDTKKLRDEVRDLPSYKNLTQAAPVYKSMFEAAGRDNRAADVNLIYGMAKIMDPGSVVRESEMTVAQAVATLPQQLQSTIMSQLNSTGRLSPEVRAAIMQEAHSRVGAYQSVYDTDMGMYRSIAEQGRFNPSHVIPQFGPFEQFKVQPAAPPPATTPPPASGRGARPGVNVQDIRKKYNLE